MRARRFVVTCAFGALGALVTAGACVDLFHGTDFETLCEREPTNAACHDGADVRTADGGGEGATPATDFCALTSGEVDALARRACAYLGACAGAMDGSAFGPCVEQARYVMDCRANPSYRPTGDVATIWQCLSSATTCEAVDACIFDGPLPRCTLGDGGASFVSCGTSGASRDTLVECSGEGERPSAVDLCALHGRHCETTSAGISRCTSGAPGACIAAKTYGCDGTRILDCQGDAGADRGVDCAGFGAGTCATSASGNVACAPVADAGTCSARPLQCSEDIVQGCVEGRQVNLDCRDFGLTCTSGVFPTQDVSLPDGGVRSAPLYDPLAYCKATECNADRCDENGDLETCVFGRVTQVDCRALNLGACTTKAGHASCGKP